MAPNTFDFDFETHPIDGHAVPEAVGLAYAFPGEQPEYIAWGHATNNNGTKDKAREVLRRAWNLGLEWLGHGVKFDIAILREQFEIDLFSGNGAPCETYHDTGFLAFLADPHAFSYELKPLAKKLINYPTEDRDDMAAWVWEHKDQLLAVTGRKVTRKNGKDAHGRVLAGNPMEFVPQMPGDLVGRYAIGDIRRTRGLFEHLYPYVVDTAGMAAPYLRERELLPIFMENERDGIRVAGDILASDVDLFRIQFDFVEDAIRTRLGDSNLNLDADQDFAHALIRAGVVREDQFERTPKKGEYRVGKDSLRPGMFTDPNVASAVGYRNRLKTCLTMFMEPWLAQASENNNYVRTHWNQTRGGDGGTRTGRPSTTNPNFLNISKNFAGRPDGYVHPDFLGVAELPLVRKYMLPDPGGLWGHRDFDGQEMRVFAHYEEGDLLAQFLANPELDPHLMIAEELARVTNDPLWADASRRTYVKNINFGKVYGAGVPRIMQVMGSSRSEAQALSSMHDLALPGRKVLNDVLVSMAKRGAPLRTWGGRVYFAEEPKYIDGKLMTWEYKLLNYLVQGSAADITKQSLIDWHRHPLRDKASRFLVTVYDEINVSMPESDVTAQMAVLKDVMNADRLDCPMRSTAKIGPSWGDAKKVKD